MVAPRTRAERPAEIVPAARPARSGTRRVPPDATDGADGSPPKRGAKANGSPDPAHLNGAGADGANAVATPAPASPPRASTKVLSPEAMGEQLIAMILE